MGEADLQPLVTRCPECATQFRVSEAQLQVAKGKVRCGSCLNVFEGVDNLVWDEESQPPSGADKALDDVLNDLSSKQAPAPKAKELATAEPESATPNTAEPAAAQHTAPDAPPNPSPADHQRDVLVAQLLAAAESQPASPAQAVEPIEVPAETDLVDLGPNYVGPDYAALKRTDQQRAEQQQRSRKRRDALAEIRALNAGQAAAEEAAHQAQVQQAEAAKAATRAEQARNAEANKSAQQQKTKRAVQQAKPPTPAAADDDDFVIDENHIADTPPSTPAVTEKDLAAAAELTRESTGQAQVASAQPSQRSPTNTAYPGESELEQVWERKAPAESFDYSAADDSDAAVGKPRWRTPAIAVASLLLLAQVFYLQFEDWAVNPILRPVYAGVCWVAGCDLPFRRDMALLKSRNLKVRSHPEIEGKLLADALIVNEAEFDQPFPVLHLGFSDASGNPMDTQRFEPEDYLAGDLADAKLMPARTPVHISVVAEDPGPQAFGYTLKLE